MSELKSVVVTHYFSVHVYESDVVELASLYMYFTYLVIRQMKGLNNRQQSSEMARYSLCSARYFMRLVLKIAYAIDQSREVG